MPKDSPEVVMVFKEASGRVRASKQRALVSRNETDDLLPIMIPRHSFLLYSLVILSFISFVLAGSEYYLALIRLPVPEETPRLTRTFFAPS